MQDFENVKLEDRVVAEDFVFDARCPADPASAGYGGTCVGTDIHQGGLEVGQHTWHLSSRVRYSNLF